MKTSLSILLLWVCCTAFPAGAAEGVLVSFVLSETVGTPESGEKRSYESSFLFAFGERAAADFNELFRLEFSAEEAGDSVVLNVDLFELAGDQRHHIGTYKGSILLGSEAVESWPAGEQRVYSLALRPTKAELPKDSG